MVIFICKKKIVSGKMYSKISINSKTFWENTFKNFVKTFLAMSQGYRDSLDNASRELENVENI
jgi:hypothetical protein